MDFKNEDVIQRQFIHSIHVKKRDGDAVVVKEKLKLKDGSITSNLRIYDNPKRTFYLTKQQYRNHKSKKTYEYIDNLNKFACRNSDLAYALKKAINKFPSSNRLDSLLNNPYVYGADISVEALIKMKYLDDNKDKPLLPLDIGYLDIETSMMNKAYLDDNNVLIISFTHNNTVYTGFLKHLMYHEDPETMNMVPFTLEDLKKKSHEVLCDVSKEHDFTYNYFVAESEKALISWAFKTIEKNNTDFMSIWNMGFDIPHLIKRVNGLNMDLKDVFCNSTLPRELQNSYYSKDKGNASHFSLKWDWFYNTSQTQQLDGLSLYSNLRKTSGFEASYRLDYILEKNIGLRKLSLGKEQSHVIMQSRHFLDYIVYNQFDVVGPMIMENMNNDILQLYKRSEANTINKFPRMTQQLKNNLYYFFKNQGKITSSIGSNSKVPQEDKFWRCECGNLTGANNEKVLCEVCETRVLAKIGGAVLPPSKCVGVGLTMRNNELRVF